MLNKNEKINDVESKNGLEKNSKYYLLLETKNNEKLNEQKLKIDVV